MLLRRSFFCAQRSLVTTFLLSVGFLFGRASHSFIGSYRFRDNLPSPIFSIINDKVIQDEDAQFEFLHTPESPCYASSSSSSHSSSRIKIFPLIATSSFPDLLNISLTDGITALGDNLGLYFVVTKASDTETIKTVRSFNGKAMVATTNVWSAQGAVWNKAGALRMLQDKVAKYCFGKNVFFLIMDADTVLNKDFSSLSIPALQSSIQELLDKSKGFSEETLKDVLFGVKRKVFPTFDDYINNRDVDAIKAGQTLGTAPGKPFLGFFQLYHSSSMNRYPVWSRDAAYSDDEFASLFQKKILLPGHVAHLGVPGINWHGRLSERWDKSTSVR
jgi:hypothetical protein